MKIFSAAKTKKTLNHWPRNVREWQIAIVDFAFDVVVIFLLVFLVIRPFVVAPFQVRQQSMEPNIHDSEYIIVTKLPYNSIVGWRSYARGDVVVFRPQTNPQNYLIKRVVGLPGETIRITEGAVFVKTPDATEFVELTDDFLSEGNQGSTCAGASIYNCVQPDQSEVSEFVVPAGKYFVLGDNRVASRDSRTCFVGVCNDPNDRYISKSDIEGRALFVFFPVSDFRFLNQNPFEKIAN